MKTENTPQSASEKAAVMLAFDRGEIIEVRRVGSEIWERAYSPTWDWNHSEWRVMAKPAECWIWVHSNGEHGICSYGSKHQIENCYIGSKGRAVFMREVIE